MTHWASFATHENLWLAWHRLLRSTHFPVKDRVALAVFEANLDANIEHTISEIVEETYLPSVANRFYIPKRQGTARALTVLSVRDQLVYQAISNIVVESTSAVFEAGVGDHVFAHLPNASDSKFMLKRWTSQYRKFHGAVTSVWDGGFKWLVEADIASFYDTIDHDLLGRSLLDIWSIDEKLVRFLIECLRSWSSTSDVGQVPRGLPQGHHSSDYLATLFLYATDRRMVAQPKARYLRYVDDIRLLAQTADDANAALLSS